MKIEMSEEAAKVLDDYALRKAIRLEESGLTDSYCYPKLMEAHAAIRKALREGE